MNPESSAGTSHAATKSSAEKILSGLSYWSSNVTKKEKGAPKAPPLAAVNVLLA
jgi:hypothetical protein